MSYLKSRFTGVYCRYQLYSIFSLSGTLDKLNFRCPIWPESTVLFIKKLVKESLRENCHSEGKSDPTPLATKLSSASSLCVTAPATGYLEHDGKLGDNAPPPLPLLVGKLERGGDFREGDFLEDGDLTFCCCCTPVVVAVVVVVRNDWRWVSFAADEGGECGLADVLAAELPPGLFWRKKNNNALFLEFNLLSLECNKHSQNILFGNGTSLGAV